jgi:hypothetical protein
MAATLGHLAALEEARTAARRPWPAHGAPEGAVRPPRVSFGSPDRSRDRLPRTTAESSCSLDPMATSATHGSSVRHNLPASFTSFIGREQELTEVQARLAGARLVTLTGVGGCGKTRLACWPSRSASRTP